MIARNAFDYAVYKILEGRCVPVAGAGISMGSSLPNGERIHNVSWMVKTIKAALYRLRFARYKPHEHGSVCSCWCAYELESFGYGPFVDVCNGNCFFCDISKAASDNRLGFLSELFLWEFDDINEAYKSLVELLQIKEYRELSPTNAHCYIAKLAREGLIGEIITTNYDCNFEVAYNVISGGSNSDVIASLDDYRKSGANRGEIYRLKVFKVNGCSERLNDNKKFESILLTERQLQKWRNRQWAADVFKDRLRSKSLLFIGFGSDEPQVHHTLQTVLDEYTDELEENGQDVLATHSAPIVAIFDAYPTFHQQQIVNTYAMHHKRDPQEGEKLIIRNPDRNKNLSADDLWGKIYERVARELLIDALQSSIQSMNASFTAILPFSDVILHQIISTIEGSAKNDSDHETRYPSWLQSISDVTGASNGEQNPYSILAASLSRINGSPLGRYDPINENKSLISELSTLLFLLEGQLAPCSQEECDGGFGLAIKTLDEDLDTKLLYLNADHSFVPSWNEVSIPSGNNHLALAIGQAGSRVEPSLRRVINRNSETASIAPKTIVTLGWQHIFYQKPYGGSKDAVVNTILDAAVTPTNYFYANQPSIKRHSYLREA